MKRWHLHRLHSRQHGGGWSRGDGVFRLLRRAKDFQKGGAICGCPQLAEHVPIASLASLRAQRSKAGPQGLPHLRGEVSTGGVVERAPGFHKHHGKENP